MSIGHKGMMVAAKTLSLSAIELFTSPELLTAAKTNFADRKAGKEYTSRCPFHEDKTPSFSVSEEKGIFHCFGCGAKGDVFYFTMQLEGIGFREAKARLGVTDDYRPRPLITALQWEAAEVAAAWMAEQRRKINVLLGEVLEKT